MEKNFFKFIAIAGLAATLLTSCEKENNEPVSPSSPEMSGGAANPVKVQIEDLELAGIYYKQWMYNKWFINGQPIQFPSCDLDNILTFYRNGNYIEYDGPTSCDTVPNGGIANQGPWNISPDGKYFNVTSPDLTGSLLILELTPETFGFQFEYPGQGTVQLWLKAKQ